MKTFIAVLFAALFIAGCEKKMPDDNKKPDNAAVRYGTSLSEDTKKAREAAAKANIAIAEEGARMEEASQQLQ